MPCSSEITSQNCKGKEKPSRYISLATRPIKKSEEKFWRGKSIRVGKDSFERPPSPLPLHLTLAPIWLPHWPACKCTISRMVFFLLMRDLFYCRAKKNIPKKKRFGTGGNSTSSWQQDRKKKKFQRLEFAGGRILLIWFFSFTVARDFFPPRFGNGALRPAQCHVLPGSPDIMPYIQISQARAKETAKSSPLLPFEHA